MHDMDYVRRLEREFHSQKLSHEKFRTVTLGCGHRVQLMAPRDQYIKCPSCGKEFMYIHSMINKRLISNG